MTVEDRKSGWLDQHAHASWREVLLHTLHRYHLAAPAYCLMPDHMHVLLVGLAATSDQRRAMSFLRKYSGRMFAVSSDERHGAEAAPLQNTIHRWQRQAYDHVLRKEESTRDGFAAVLHYVVENPMRAGLVDEGRQWPYSGSILAGWPDLDWRREDFWERWWKIFADTADSAGAGSRSATPAESGP